MMPEYPSRILIEQSIRCWEAQTEISGKLSSELRSLWIASLSAIAVCGNFLSSRDPLNSEWQIGRLLVVGGLCLFGVCLLTLSFWRQGSRDSNKDELPFYNRQEIMLQDQVWNELAPLEQMAVLKQYTIALKLADENCWVESVVRRRARAFFSGGIFLVLISVVGGFLYA